MTEKTTQKLKYLTAISCALLALLVYLPVLRNDFVGVWDDNIYIVENPHIRSLDGTFFQWAFLDFYASNWHPLTWISLAVDYSLWGLNPFGFHLTNIVLHAANTFVVVLLVMALLEILNEQKKERESSEFLSDRTVLITAGVTGLLFGLHPIHVESVAWVAERKDLLCALFFLLSIIMYTRYVKAGRPDAVANNLLRWSFKNRYLVALGFFVLALLSKPMAVTLPVVLLILDWYPFGRLRSWKTFRPIAAEKLPFIFVSIASSIITILAQSTGESVASLDFVPLSSRILVAVRSLASYLAKMLLPLNLVPFYPYPKNAALFSFEYLLAFAFVFGITIAAADAAKKQRAWLSAWGYYVATLMPVLGIVQVGNQAMADRYAYLPSIGPLFASAFVMVWIVGKVNAFYRSFKIKFIYTALAFCLFSSLSYITIKQTDIWKNGFVLWNHTILKGFESATAYNNRGLSLEGMGERNKARTDFERAIALDPRNYFSYNNMGVMYGKEGQYQRSTEYFLKAISINPKHADSYCNLGLSYFYMNQYENAVENYNKAIRLNQDFDMAYLNRGNLYVVMGNNELAVADYRKSCRLGNENACAILNMMVEQ